MILRKINTSYSNLIKLLLPQQKVTYINKHIHTSIVLTHLTNFTLLLCSLEKTNTSGTCRDGGEFFCSVSTSLIMIERCEVTTGTPKKKQGDKQVKFALLASEKYSLQSCQTGMRGACRSALNCKALMHQRARHDHACTYGNLLCQVFPSLLQRELFQAGVEMRGRKINSLSLVYFLQLALRKIVGINLPVGGHQIINTEGGKSSRQLGQVRLINIKKAYTVRLFVRAYF